MQPSNTLIKISDPITKVNKIWIDQRFRKYFSILERIQAKLGVRKEVNFFPIAVEQSGRQHNPNKKNCYLNKNIYFRWKLAI